MSSPASRGRRQELRYHAALDGLRALAVAGVLLYHGGVPWGAGGFLGVEVFFVLSGFLITSLLVGEWHRSSRIALAAFWARRARRLLPALFCLVAVCGIYYAVAGPTDAAPGLRADGISTLLYAGNWHQIATGSSYFAATGPVSPLKHTWSLAIEEQFYVLWPLLVVAVLALTRRFGRARGIGSRPLRVLLAVTVAGVVGSAIETGLLFNGGRGLDRVYYGTDTRAGSLLAGAALAIWLTLWRTRLSRLSQQTGTSLADRRGGLLALLAAVGLAGVALAFHFADANSTWLYPFGLLAVDVAVCMMILAVVLGPRSPVARALAVRPVRAIGQISYGIYLWHFPLFLWLDAGTTGLDGAGLFLVRVAVTVAVSLLSFVLIEQPIRRQRLPKVAMRTLAPAAAAAAVLALLVASGVQSRTADANAAPAPPRSTAKLTGTSSCQVTLTDTAEYGLAPLPRRIQVKSEETWLGNHKLKWSGTTKLTYNTCPPKKLLLVGDSLAFTLGVGLMDDEQRYGVEIANAGILGCAFTSTGELNVSGDWQAQSAGCPNALETWAREAKQLDAEEVIVELGYRDMFDWKLNGAVAHLGQKAYDTALQREMDRYADVLGNGGKRKVLFLSVPWTKPPANPDGSPAPAASSGRHSAINEMIEHAASGRRNVSVLDIDRVVSPAGRYQGTVNSKLCRFDGIHFSIYCAKLLQPGVLSEARKLIAG